MDYQDQVAKAVKSFWKVRTEQHRRQGAATGIKDAGNRSAVTGGKHLDGFRKLLTELLSEAGLRESTIHTRATALPGYFRPTKNWDLVVVVDGVLLASIEFKGSCRTVVWQQLQQSRRGGARQLHRPAHCLP